MLQIIYNTKPLIERKNLRKCSLLISYIMRISILKQDQEESKHIELSIYQ